MIEMFPRQDVDLSDVARAHIDKDMVRVPAPKYLEKIRHFAEDLFKLV